MKLFSLLRTVRARLTLLNMTVLALVLIILGVILRLTVERNLMASVDGEIAQRARFHQHFWAHVRVRPGGFAPWDRPPRFHPSSAARTGMGNGFPTARSTNDARTD